MNDSSFRIDVVAARIGRRAREGVQRGLLSTYEAAWAALALAAHGAPADELVFLCDLLVQRQLDDGRVVLDPALPDVHWPTPLAVLAWGRGGERYARHRRVAVDFLLRVSGVHWERTGKKFSGHDPSIRGWSWLSTTHSWVEPTSMAMIGLKAAGKGDHARVGEAVRMLLDRQLAGGGWNYGNTSVFDTPLLPIPEDTGYALAALAGSVEEATMGKSLTFLETACAGARTPATLSWGLNGLSAWGRRPASARPWIAASLALQDRLGEYDIRHLSQLVVSYYATEGVVAWARELA